MTQSAANIPSSSNDRVQQAARDRRLANSIAIGFLVLLIAGLALLPSLLRQTEYVFPASRQAGATRFPMDIALPVHNGWKGGPPVPLKQLMGTHPTAIVNLWATWCPPCVDELPSLEYLHRQLQALPAETAPILLTLSVDENYADVNDLFATLNFSPSFLVIHDGTATIARKVGTFRFPETYWVDKEGTILHKWVGPQDWMGERVLSQLHEGLKPSR